MELTGKQLFDLYWERGAADDRPAWDAVFKANEDKWGALAEKLNGMMAGELREVDRTNILEDLKTINQRWGEILAAVNRSDERERSRHHGTCPYRHGTGDCTC